MQVKDVELGLLDVGEQGDEFEELVGSIRRDGVLSPLLVKPCGDRYLVVEGHRRRQAALRIGLAAVPCAVLPGDERLARRAAFVTNLIRKDPTPIELAVALAKAANEGQVPVTEIAQGLGRSVEWVKRQIAMLDWPEDVLQLVHAGVLSVAAAGPLAQVADEAYRQFLLEHASRNGATARTTSAWLQEWLAGQPAPKAVEVDPPARGPVTPPLYPQAPCLCCSRVLRMDELSHVPLCAGCIQRVREFGRTLP
jgi:ParB family chromosome partitioning protein